MSDSLGDRFNILILSPNYRSFGNSIEEIFFGLLHCQDKGKKLLLIKPFRKFLFKKINISNSYLYELEHDLLIKPNAIRDFIFSFLITVMASFGYLESKIRLVLANTFGLKETFVNNKDLSRDSCQHFGKRRLWGFSEEKIYNQEKWECLEENYSSPDLPHDLVCKSKIFIENNFPEVGNKKWITLHVLDNTKTKIARGADIDSYNQTIEYLINEGYVVFRIGNSTMPKCNHINGLIDLAHYDHENFLDLFLVKNAEFHIGLGSGPNYLTHLFKKDLFVTNLTEWSTSLPRKKGNFFILKKFYKASNGEKISVLDLFNEGFNFQINTNFYENKNLLIEDNTSAEILTALVDFLEFDIRECAYSDEQILFDEFKNSWLLRELVKKDVKIEYSSNKDYEIQRIRSIALSMVNGTMASTYLKENWK